MTIKELTASIHTDGSWYNFSFSVEGVPEEYFNAAKKKDGDDYSQSCMIIEAYYDVKEQDLSYKLVYITEDGDDLEWPCELSDADEAKMLKIIREEILYE